MGEKSRNRAEKRQAIRKRTAFAKLNNVPTSPRKMRLVADLIRGKRVEQALHILKTSPKQPAERLRKLLLSAISNWQAKNEGLRLEDSDVYIQSITVDGGRTLKRIQTAPQGRAHRLRKRSNHVTIVLDSLNKPAFEEQEEEVDDEIAEDGAVEPVAEEQPVREKKAARPRKKKKEDNE